jgi:outer membrane lipoprotein-sorting protein
MRRHVLTTLLSCLLVPALVAIAHAQTQTADQIVEKHLAALGGRAALGKLTTRKATGTVTTSTPAGDLPGSAEVYSKAPNKTHAILRLDVSALGGSGEVVVEQVFDGKTGFSLNSMQGDADITGRQLDNMRNNLFPSALLNYKDNGTRIEVLPPDTINGRDAIVLRLTPKTGSPITLCLDTETYLIARTTTTVDNPAGGEMEQTVEPSDYRTVDGVKVAFVVVNSNELQTLTLHLSKVEHNVAIDDAMFVKK